MVRVVRVVIDERDEGQNQNKKLPHVYMTSAALNYSPDPDIRTGTSCLFLPLL